MKRITNDLFGQPLLTNLRLEYQAHVTGSRRRPPPRKNAAFLGAGFAARPPLSAMICPATPDDALVPLVRACGIEMFHRELAVRWSSPVRRLETGPPL